MQSVVVGLCGPARHDIPNVDNFLFPAVVESPLDFASHYNTSMDFISRLPDDSHLLSITTIVILTIMILICFR
mgnify:CR=1 FL=1